MPVILIGTCVDYIDSCYNFDHDFCDEIKKIFISNLRDIIFFHYMQQPKSMLVRKLIGNYLEGKKEVFLYNWLPKRFIQIIT